MTILKVTFYWRLLVMVYKFTKSGEKVLEIANELAVDFGHDYIGTEHILYGLSCEENGVAGKVLEKKNVFPEDILDKIEELIGGLIKDEHKVVGFTPRSKKILENAYVESKKYDSNLIGTEHILIGLVNEPDSIALKILEELKELQEKYYRDSANPFKPADKPHSVHPPDSSGLDVHQDQESGVWCRCIYRAWRHARCYRRRWRLPLGRESHTLRIKNPLLGRSADQRPDKGG